MQRKFQSEAKPAQEIIVHLQDKLQDKFEVKYAERNPKDSTTSST